MAAPFTPFHEDGDVKVEAIPALAQLFRERFGINAVWVMGMRGQYDALTSDERKIVAEAWVEAGKAQKLFTIIQIGDSSNRQAAELAAHAESIGADAIGALGPYEELCGSTQCVVDFLAPVAAAAPRTPFFYYHTRVEWKGIERGKDVRLVQARCKRHTHKCWCKVRELRRFRICGDL